MGDWQSRQLGGSYHGKFDNPDTFNSLCYSRPRLSESAEQEGLPVKFRACTDLLVSGTDEKRVSWDEMSRTAAW